MQPGNHPEEIRTEKFYQNPVKARWVRNEEEDEWSSEGYFWLARLI
jgi:hypothetical protein